MQVSILLSILHSRDAVGACVINQARFFLRRGDEVRVFTEHPAEGMPDDLAPLVRTTSLADLIAPRDDYFARSDLYVYHYPMQFQLVESIKGIARGAVIFYYHNVTPAEFWSAPMDRLTFRNSIDSSGRLAPYADLIVTPSPFNADQLVREYGCDPDDVVVLPNAVALDKFSPGARDAALLECYRLDGKRVMLYVGRMAGNKRIDLLLSACALVREAIPNVVLLLVGDGQSNPSLRENVAMARARAAELGMSESVIFTDRVEDLPAHYRLADVYVSASLHEGFGVPLIEAMASGVPVVASRATAHPWVVADAGLLCEPGDPAAMAAQVIQVMTDDHLHGDLVRRGIARSREFSLERYEAGWAAIVARVTAGMPTQPYPRARAVAAQPSPQTPDGAEHATLQTRLDYAQIRSELERLQPQADVMLRGYTVRSRIPLLGSLIVWVRRNLTSHLREPYLDIMLERQVSFNHQLLTLMRQLAEVPLASPPPPAQGNEQDSIAGPELAARLDLLSLQLSSLIALLSAFNADHNRASSLSLQLAQLQVQLDVLQQTFQVRRQ